MEPSPPKPSFPTDLADRCVKCGLCLPHCPTYRLAGVEGESPRGRIALMQGVASGRLAAGAGLRRHIDQCLACRACESVCPAGVPYGQILDAGRAMLAASPDAPRQASSLRWLFRRPGLAGMLVNLARVTGLAGRVAGSGVLPGRLGRAAALLPPGARPFRATRTGRRRDPGARSVQLFTGCVSRSMDHRTLADAVRLLEAAGFQVEIPAGQGCCGAMDQHGGHPEMARRLAQRNVRAFAGSEAVATVATGCASTLCEYGRLAPENGEAFGRRVRDVSELVADAPLGLRPPPWKKVSLHLPCTQRNVTGTGEATRRLLTRLPGVELSELPAGCCGAAGEMFLSRPELSDALLAPLIETLAAEPPDAVATSNVGCMLHLSAGLRRAGLDIPVLHPVSVAVAGLASDQGVD
ncbi:MAG: heterodisulfide reductase-related iron-sulfur binding cluster [Gammaproteobacteria bacterium]